MAQAVSTTFDQKTHTSHMAHTSNEESFGRPSQETLRRWAERALEEERWSVKKERDALKEFKEDLEKRAQILDLSAATLVERQMDLNSKESEINDKMKVIEKDQMNIARIQKKLDQDQLKKKKRHEQLERYERMYQKQQQKQHKQLLQEQLHQEQLYLEQIQFFNWLSVQAPSFFWMHSPLDVGVNNPQNLSPRSIPLPPGLDCEDVIGEDVSSFFLPPPGLVHPSKEGAKNAQGSEDSKSTKTVESGEIAKNFDEWLNMRMSSGVRK